MTKQKTLAGTLALISRVSENWSFMAFMDLPEGKVI